MASITVLARLLTPEDFGLVGFLGSFTVILTLLRDMGLSPAIIQSERNLDEELNSLLLVSAGIGTLLFFLVSLVGIFLASFMGDPRIAWIAPWYGVMFLIDALGVIPLALMRREMQFKEIAIRDTLSNLLGIIVGITAAIYGASYWSLVLMAGSTSISACLLSWKCAGWLPQRKFVPFSQIKPLVLYGGAFTGGQLANVISENLDKLLIGRFFGMTELGYYTRAHVLIQTPTTALLGPVQTVLFPIMSKARQNSEHYRDAVIFWGKSTVYLFAILAALAAASSQGIVSLILGNEWSVTVDVFRWLALLLFARPLGSMVYLIMISEGNMKVFSAWVWTNVTLTIVAIVIGLKWGPTGVAAALGLAGVVLGVPIALWFLARAGNFQIEIFLYPYLFASVIGLSWYYILLKLMSVTGSWSLGNYLQISLTSVASLGLIAAGAGITYHLRSRHHS